MQIKWSLTRIEKEAHEQMVNKEIYERALVENKKHDDMAKRIWMKR